MQIGGIYHGEFEAILGGDGKKEVYSAGSLMLLCQPTEKSYNIDDNDNNNDDNNNDNINNNTE